MEHFLNYGLWDLYEVMFWVYDTFNDFLDKVFEGEYGWLFYVAFLPGVMLFVFDLVMTFILSFRCRQLRFFNVFSLKSWNALRFKYSGHKELSNTHFRYVGVSPRYKKFKKFFLKKFKKFKAGDSFTVSYDDGSKNKFVYGGMKINSNGQLSYLYSVNGVSYSSRYKPIQLATKEELYQMDIQNRISNFGRNQAEQADERKRMSKKYSLDIVADDID